MGTIIIEETNTDTILPQINLIIPRRDSRVLKTNKNIYSYQTNTEFIVHLPKWPEITFEMVFIFPE